MNKAQIKAKKQRKQERDRQPWWKKKKSALPVTHVPTLDEYFSRGGGGLSR